MSATEKETYLKEYRSEDDLEKRTKRRTGRKPDEEKGFQLKFSVIALIVMMLLTSFANYIPRLKEPDEESEYIIPADDAVRQLDKELRQEAYYAAIEVLKNPATSQLRMSQQSARIKSKLDFLLQTEFADKYNDFKGWKLEVVNLESNLSTKPVHIIGGTVQPGYYDLNIKYDVTPENANSGSPGQKRIMSFTLTLMDPYPFMEHAVDQIRFDSGVQVGRIQKMVGYMLTTLVRHRLKQEYGFEAYESQFNILNEGDIELAVNLALLFEELTVLKNYDTGAAVAIDKYYKSARIPEEHSEEPNWSPSNPTGHRYWRTAEVENFDKLYSHVIQSGIERSIAELLESALQNGGHIDPADFYALYLILDREFTEVTIDPADNRALLDELHLWDPRVPSDNTDVLNMKTLLNITQPYIWDISTGTTPLLQKINELITVDHSPDYLVVGQNLNVAGLEKPMGWYTDIYLTGTRTWGIVPPFPPPPHHDYRIQWDLDIQGEYTLSLGSLWNKKNAEVEYDIDKPPSQYLHDSWLNTTIKLDFPVSVYGWLAALPQNNMQSYFSNQNPLIWDAPNDTYIQLPAAQVKEYFSDRLWKDIKPLANIVMDRLDFDSEFFRDSLASGIGIFNRGIDMSREDDLSNSLLTRQIEGYSSAFWDNLELFTEYYLRNYNEKSRFWNYSESRLWFHEGGFNISISYSEDFQDLSFRLQHNSGVLELKFSDIGSSGPSRSVDIENNIIISGQSLGMPLLDYTYSLTFNGSRTDSGFKGFVGVGRLKGFEINNDINNSVYRDNRIMYYLPVPDLIVSYPLPVYESGGVQQDFNIRLGLYEVEGSENELSAFALDLAQELAAAVEDIPISDDVLLGDAISTAQLRGYIYKITQFLGQEIYNLHFDRFNSNYKQLLFAVNTSFLDASGKVQYRELGFYFDTVGIEPFIDLYSESFYEALLNLQTLPDSAFEIINHFGDINSIIYLIEGDEQINVINIVNSPQLFNPESWAEAGIGMTPEIRFSIIDHLPAFKQINTIENVEILSTTEIPDVKKEFLLKSYFV